MYMQWCWKQEKTNASGSCDHIIPYNLTVVVYSWEYGWGTICSVTSFITGGRTEHPVCPCVCGYWRYEYWGCVNTGVGQIVNTRRQRVHGRCRGCARPVVTNQITTWTSEMSLVKPDRCHFISSPSRSHLPPPTPFSPVLCVGMYRVVKYYWTLLYLLVSTWTYY